jgi:oligopeptidase B
MSKYLFLARERKGFKSENNRFTRQSMRQHKFLHKIVLQEMKKKLYSPNTLPPLKTISNGYEYYSTTSAYGMVYLRKKLGEGRDAPEVFIFFLCFTNLYISNVIINSKYY